MYATTPPSTATKKEKQTETIDSRFYRIAENKDVKIKAVEHVLKRAAVDCALNRNGNVPKFDKTINALTSSGRKLKIKLGNKDYSRECDYEKCDYKCVWMPEKGKHYKINIDTYNERFARTDIENAKRIIKKLYQTWYVYELEDLINAVRKKMKKLEVEFIYQGINELIDNINEPVYDQYDRKGYLIYRGTYYVYQPLEFNYLQSPLWYRTVPINEKAPFYIFENEVQNYNNVNVVKNEKQVSSKQLLEILLAKAEQLYQDIPYRDKEKMYIILGMLIDPLDYKEKTNILKIVLSNYYDTKGKMDNVYYSDILKYMDSYLIFKERDLEYGKERNNKKDKIIGYTINGKYFCYNFDTRLFSECSTDIKDKIKLSRKIRATKESKLDSKAFNNIYGFMEKWKNGKFVFKIFDGTKETGALTLNKSRSKRSEIKGKKCETFSSSELNDISKKLHIDIKAKQIKLICRNIEYSLRLYNLQNKNNLRWFRYADS